jgi:multiple sugar transport system substrate-binding protein
MRSKRFALSVLSLVVVGALAASCAPEDTAVPATSTPTTSAPGETPTAPAGPSGDVLIWVMPNGADPQAAIDAEIAAFEAEYPDVNVTAEIVGWGDAYGAIQTAVQGGEGPCITQMGTTWVPTFGTMGGLHTFTEDDMEDLGGEDAFIDASMATGKIFDNIVALPWFADVRAIMYRTDVLAAAGVTPEEAFDDTDGFIAALEAIRDSGQDIAGLVHPGRNDWNVWQNATQWGWAYGGDILTEDGTAAAFNAAEFAAGVAQYYQLYGMGLTPGDTLELNSSQTDEAYGKGRAAMTMTGPWMISNLRNLEASGYEQVVADNTAIAPFPTGPTGVDATFFGGSDLGIMTSCPNYEAAWAFVKYLLSDESQIRYGNAIGMLPATTSAQGDPIFVDDPLFSVFIDAAPTGKSSPNIPRWGAVENTLNTALQALWEDVAAVDLISEATVQDRLDEAAETVNTVLSY